jgi:dolichol-phosphate mannosyltransferase
MPRLIAALPAYNEAECLPRLLKSFGEMFAEQKLDEPVIIVVDDGSKDDTAGVCRRAAESLPVRLVQHPQNRGLGAAIITGLKTALEEARSDDDVIVCMDADDTHPPRFVPSMLEQVRAGADMVIASRYQPGSEQHGVPFNRLVLSVVARYMFQIVVGIPGVRDYTCGYRAFRVSLIRKGFEKYGDQLITRGGFACTDQLLVNLACLGAKIREVPFVLRYDRKVGESKINLGLTIVETFGLLLHARRELKRAGVI